MNWTYRLSQISLQRCITIWAFVLFALKLFCVLCVESSVMELTESCPFLDAHISTRPGTHRCPRGPLRLHLPPSLRSITAVISGELGDLQGQEAKEGTGLVHFLGTLGCTGLALASALATHGLDPRT